MSATKVQFNAYNITACIYENIPGLRAVNVETRPILRHYKPLIQFQCLAFYKKCMTG